MHVAASVFSLGTMFVRLRPEHVELCIAEASFRVSPFVQLLTSVESSVHHCFLTVTSLPAAPALARVCRVVHSPSFTYNLPFFVNCRTVH
jgi:hypothetical protein